jgi:glycogen synthase
MTADAVGGVWRYALDLARELGADGGEVLLATMGPAPDADQVAEAARMAG